MKKNRGGTSTIEPCPWCQKRHRSRRVFFLCIHRGFGEMFVEVVIMNTVKGMAYDAGEALVAKLRSVAATIPNA